MEQKGYSNNLSGRKPVSTVKFVGSILAGGIIGLGLFWLVITYGKQYGSLMLEVVSSLVLALCILAIIYRDKIKSWMKENTLAEQAYYSQMLGMFKSQMGAQAVLIAIYINNICTWGVNHPVEQIALWRSATIAGLLLVSMLWVMYSIWRLYTNVKKGQVFVLANAKLIRRLSMGTSLVSCVILFVGMPLVLTNGLFGGLWVMLGVLSLSFDLVGYMIMKGLEMQEEQALTI